MVRDVLGEEPLYVTHQDFGHQSLTFDVALPERNVIVRTHHNLQAYRKTAHNLAVLAGLGLPVSRVLAADLSGRAISLRLAHSRPRFRGATCATNSAR